jgi:hypothetical protein
MSPEAHRPESNWISWIGSPLSGLITAASNLVNGYLDRKQGESLELKRQRFQTEFLAWQHALTLQITHLQNDLQLKREFAQFVRTREMQLELRSLDHASRIEEQKQHFERLKVSSDYEYFKTHAWPLREPPTGLPMPASSEKTPLRVPVRLILTDSNSETYRTRFGRDISIELRSHILKHHEHSGPHCVVFYDGGWRPDHRTEQGGAYIEALFRVLQRQPTIVLEPATDHTERRVTLRVSFWGLGTSDGYVTRDLMKGTLALSPGSDQQEADQSTNQLLTVHKLCVSMLADAYHFLEYGTPPVLPSLLPDIGAASALVDLRNTVIPSYRGLYGEWFSRPTSCLFTDSALAFLREHLQLGDSTWVASRLNESFSLWLHNRHITNERDAGDLESMSRRLTRQDRNDLKAMATIARQLQFESGAAIIKAWTTWCHLFLEDRV